MKLHELKQLIKETLDEMARIASGFKLTDNWEEKWNSQPENIKNSVRFKRVIDYLTNRDEPGTLRDLAQTKFNSNDTAVVNQQVKYLKDAGILTDTGLTAPKKSDTEGPKQPGVFGRPKSIDDATKELGISIIRKFSRGNTEFTEEEKDLITKMYTSFNPVKTKKVKGD